VAVRGEGGVVVTDAVEKALASARRRSLDLRDELDGIIAAQEADPPDDEHDVEGASVGFERARVTALLAAADASVAELEAALARWADGEGAPIVCESCGGSIGDERLEALPATRLCVSCAAAR
jgi:RNA polymerase-binding transcription factor DksA